VHEPVAAAFAHLSLEGNHMMNPRRWFHRPAVYLAAVAVHGVVHLGAPANAQAQSQTPDKSWRERHPVAFDTLIGAAAGAAVGSALGATHDADVPWPYLAAGYGLLGAAIGVVPGMVTERRNERDALSPDELRRRVKNGTTIVIVNAQGQRTVGKVVDVSGDSVTMRGADGTTTTVPAGRGTWHLTSDSLKNGVLIGAALGSVFAVVNYKDGAPAAGAAAGVGIWALLGALADRAFGHQVLTATEGAMGSSAIFKLTPWLGKRSGGVAFSVGF
jgi:hypothetical protein